MKSTKKVLSLLLAVVMMVGMLAGCNAKKDPAELFVNALNMYHDAVEENALVKLMNQAAEGGSVAVKMESGEGEDKTVVNMTTYLNAAGNAASLVLNIEAEGQKIDAQMTLNQKKVTLGTSLLKDAYGIDLEKAKENFPTSLFGTKGANMLELDEESEAELLAALDEFATAMKKEAKDVDLYDVLMNALKENATFAADTKTPVTIDGKEVKNTTVTATMTKNNVKSIVNKMIAELEAQELVDEFLTQYNEEAKAEAEWSGEEAVTYENMNAVIDAMFEDKGDEDVVLTMKMVLDAKHDAIMIFEVTAEETVKVELGADPKNVTKVVVSYPTEEYPVDSTEPVTKVEKLTIDIKKSSTSDEYKMLDEDGNGLTVVINKAHKEVTFAAVEENKTLSDDAYSFKYELTDKLFSFTMTDEGDEWNEPSTITVTVNAKAESPVKHDNYKDLLTMTEEDFQKLMEELAPILEDMGMGGTEEPDVEYEYYEDGETVKSEKYTYEDGSYEVIEYAEDGSLLAMTSYNADGTVENRIEVDSEGNFVEVETENEATDAE
ncbi:MAG: hypothetical protein IJZ68_07285 [Bacteroidaceae bacterium]|nr:hypothetical protein [Bacteroidaceae bacterium]